MNFMSIKVHFILLGYEKKTTIEINSPRLLSIFYKIYITHFTM